MSLCNCPVTLGNTGRPGCITLMDVTKYQFYMNTFASDGTRNGIAIGDAVDDAYINAKINETDPTKRWYPTLKLSGVTDERADPETEDIDGVPFIIDEGFRNFTGFTPRASHIYLSKLKSGECGQLSAFNGDDSGRLSGSVSGDGLTFYPHMIEEGTFYAGLTKPTRTVTQKVHVRFNYSSLELDENLDLYGTSVDFASISATGGMLDVLMAVSAESTTGFTAVASHEYGTVNSPGSVTGLEQADFALYNNTTSSAVALTDLTESPEGTYTFEFAAQASADSLTLTSAKDGVFISQNITIP